MPVNLAPPDPAALLPISGIELGVAMAGIRKAERKDLLVMRLAPGTAVAGVFTRNRFCAAPVTIARKHVRNAVRALVVNTGNANAGTGADGIARAMSVCEALAAHLGCDARQVLPFSTGVIMEPLPAERIVAGLPRALLSQDDWLSAAQAIMTTDTVPKAYSRRLRLSAGGAAVSGIAKGAGMIRPDDESHVENVTPLHPGGGAEQADYAENGDVALAEAATKKKARPVVRPTQKVGRNDPCPCGSGKKYKHCHGKLT